MATSRKVSKAHVGTCSVSIRKKLFSWSVITKDSLYQGCTAKPGSHFLYGAQKNHWYCQAYAIRAHSTHCQRQFCVAKLTATKKLDGSTLIIGKTLRQRCTKIVLRKTQTASFKFVFASWKRDSKGAFGLRSCGTLGETNFNRKFSPLRLSFSSSRLWECNKHGVWRFLPQNCPPKFLWNFDWVFLLPRWAKCFEFSNYLKVELIRCLVRWLLTSFKVSLAFLKLADENKTSAILFLNVRYYSDNTLISS